MHVSQETFEENMNPDMYLGMGITDENMESTRILIDRLREINKNDKGFMYMCTKPVFGGGIIWHFSYTVKECYEQVKSLAEEHMKEIKKRQGKQGENIYSDGKDGYITDECSCPFL